MYGLGVIEGFFGPEWSWKSRRHFCESLPAYGGDFYIYAPKRDPYLRKNWNESHPAGTWSELKNLSILCKQRETKFGVGLSPFEIHAHWDDNAKQQVKAKIESLLELNLDCLGLFFDDMKGAPDLAEKQAEIVNYVRSLCDIKLLFCPTYYSYDPILDKVFGERPADYLKQIGEQIPEGVEILWTGPKVISETIEADHLKEVALTLKRKPFIWDNYFANDGPRQCKFLRLKPFAGRSGQALETCNGWALNIMNQPGLSEILFLASANALRGHDSEAAFKSALSSLGGDEFARAIDRYREVFNSSGLDKIDGELANEIRGALDSKNRFAAEVIDWLDGKYIVGAECLTD